MTLGKHIVKLKPIIEQSEIVLLKNPPVTKAEVLEVGEDCEVKAGDTVIIQSTPYQEFEDGELICLESKIYVVL